MVLEKLKALLADQFGVDVDSITAETDIMEDLGADSVDLVELVMTMEEEFDVGEIQEDEMPTIKTVGDAVRYLAAKMN